MIVVYPFKVPPFSPGHHTTEPTFHWWSWHPLYPCWSKSCWSGKTKEEAMEKITKPIASSMKYYHNKLIMEKDGQFIEVFDLPCQTLDRWEVIKSKMTPEELKQAGW